MKTALCGLAALVLLSGCSAAHRATAAPVPSPQPVYGPYVVFGPQVVHADRSRPTPPAKRRLSPSGEKHVDKNVPTQDVTSYCGDTTTWSGLRPVDGMVAVLDRSIPKFSHAHVYGELYGPARAIWGPYYDRTFLVTDHVGHGTDVDIFMTSCSRGDIWGRQHLHVVYTH